MMRFRLRTLMLVLVVIAYGCARLTIGDKWDHVLIPGTCILVLVPAIYLALSRYELWLIAIAGASCATGLLVWGAETAEELAVVAVLILIGWFCYAKVTRPAKSN